MNEIIQDVFYSYITDFIKMWLFLWGLLNFQPIRSKKIYIIVGIVQFSILVLNGFIYKINYDTVMFISLGTVVVVIAFLFEGKFLKKLSHALLAYVLITFLDACIIEISSLLANMSVLDYIKYSIVQYIYNSINIITIILLIILKRKKFKTKFVPKIPKSIYILLFVGTLTGIIILATLSTKIQDAKSENIRRIMVVVIIIAIVAYIIACIMMIIITESRNNYKVLYNNNQNIIETQQKDYILVNEKQLDIHNILSEMINHLSCIQSLYNANKLSEMEHYIKQLINATDISEMLFNSGNEIVNTILNYLQSKYIKDNIIIRLNGGFPEDLHVSPIDLCIIFANIVSNAIEAIQLMDRETDCIQYIDIKIKCFNDELFIDVKSPIRDNSDINIYKPKTLKKNNDLHGFGVKSIIQKVEKYNGMVNFRCNKNEFILEIMIKNRTVL